MTNSSTIRAATPLVNTVPATNEARREAKAKVIACIVEGIAQADACTDNSWILVWPHGLGVGVGKNGAYVANLVLAYGFHDSQSAMIWASRRGIKNGAGERPQPMRRQTAIKANRAELVKCLAEIEAIEI